MPQVPIKDRINTVEHILHACESAAEKYGNPDLQYAASKYEKELKHLKTQQLLGVEYVEVS